MKWAKSEEFSEINTQGSSDHEIWSRVTHGAWSGAHNRGKRSRKSECTGSVLGQCNGDGTSLDRACKVLAFFGSGPQKIVCQIRGVFVNLILGITFSQELRSTYAPYGRRSVSSQL